MLDSLELLRELVAAPAPPGQEEAARAIVGARVSDLGYQSSIDPKGNLLVRLPGPQAADVRPRVVVTAHLDEIALMVSRIEPDGRIRVIPMGGAHPWKWGEQPVQILAAGEPMAGALCFGSIHTDSPAAVVQQARIGPLLWEHAYIFTGLSPETLAFRGVRPGTRVVLDPERRSVKRIGPHLCTYFIDDRADLVVWLLALEALLDRTLEYPVLFAATASEEVGGEGASYLLHQLQPEVCIALEIGPSVPESRFFPDEQPTIWVTDSFASSSASDLDLLAEVCEELGQRPHWQALSRGGSDATCTAQRGLTARPITLGLPVENSHGLEIMHQDAPAQLSRLLVALLERLGKQESEGARGNHAP